MQGKEISMRKEDRFWFSTFNFFFILYMEFSSFFNKIVMKFFIVGILRLLLWIIFILNKFNWFFNFLVNFYLMKSSFVLTYCFQSSSSCSFKENEYSFPSHINFYRSVTFLPLIIKLKHFFLFFFFIYLLQWKKSLTMRKGWNVNWWNASWWINFHQSVAFLSLIIKLNNLFEFFFSLRMERQELPMRKRAELETKWILFICDISSVKFSSNRDVSK